MSLLRALTLLTATAEGVAGGALFAFSVVVMPALRTLPAAQALPAMQAINVIAPQSWLMLPLIGSAVGSVAVGVCSLVQGDVPGRHLILAGAAVGLLMLGITAIYHVPRNDTLALLDPDTAGSAAAWAAYAQGWTLWNHVRAAAGLVSAGLLVAGALKS